MIQERDSYPNALSEFFYKRAMWQKMSVDDLSKAMYISPAMIYYRMKQPISNWKIGDIFDFCRALDVPPMDAMSCAVLDLMDEDLHK